MANLNILFDLQAGKSNRQIEIEELYVSKGVDLEPLLKEALIEAIRNPTPKQYRGRGFMANNMNWTVVGMLKEKYPEFMRIDQHKRDYFLLDKNVRIYFKKLDAKNRPNNIVTKHVCELNTMQMLFHENPTTVLYAGFRLREDKYWDDISCNLVEMKNLKSPNWVSNMGELAYEIANRKAQHTPIFKADLPDQIIVKSKKAKDNDSELGKTAD